MGWSALTTLKDVTFLGPDMETYTTYKSENVLSVSESLKEGTNLHLIAFISPSVIEVFLCWNFNYTALKKSYTIVI